MNNFVFDFDGVLGNTFAPLVKYLAKATFRSEESTKKRITNYMMSNHKENFIESFIKNWASIGFERFLDKGKFDLIFSQHLEEIKDLPGKKAILTNNYSSLCKKLLGPQSDMFDVILGDKEANTKVAGLHLLFNEYGFEKENTVFVTDTVGDVVEASEILSKNQIYGATWGYHSKKLLQTVLPESQLLDNLMVLKNLDEIEQIDQNLSSSHNVS